MNKPHLVAIVGNARHGKTYTARIMAAHIITTSQIPVSVYNMSDGLVYWAALSGFIDTIDGEQLQRIGDVIKCVDKYRLIRSLLLKIKHDNPSIAIIAGIRYPYEIDWIKQSNGTVIRVIREAQDGTPYITNDRPTNHTSETQVDKIEPHRILHIIEGDFTQSRRDAAVLGDYVYERWIQS